MKFCYPWSWKTNIIIYIQISRESKVKRGRKRLSERSNFIFGLIALQVLDFCLQDLNSPRNNNARLSLLIPKHPLLYPKSK